MESTYWTPIYLNDDYMEGIDDYLFGIDDYLNGFDDYRIIGAPDLFE